MCLSLTAFDLNVTDTGCDGSGDGSGDGCDDEVRCYSYYHAVLVSTFVMGSCTYFLSVSYSYQSQSRIPHISIS